MTSRELVKRTLEFQSPARIPRQLWLLPWATTNYPDEVSKLQQEFPDDVVSSPAFLTQSPVTQGDPYSPGLFIDESGCRFENAEHGIIGIVHQPVLSDWSELEHYRLPSELLSVDREQVNAFCRVTEKFVLAGASPRPFERLQFIRTTENLLLHLVERPPGLTVLMDKLHQFYLKELDIWTRTEVDALSLSDDWGSQRMLLINPKMWRQIFKPLYQEYIELAHAHGKYMFMHSDGYILDILPDLIEMGLDAINSQLFCMDVEELGRKFKGKITFWGEIDRQQILPSGTPEEVIAAVRLVRDSFYADGGVIAQCEFGPGARPENVRLVFETWNALERVRN